MMEVAFVYLIRAKVDGDQWPGTFYKIGFSGNPELRLTQLNIKKSVNAELARIAPCHYSHRVSLEKLAHARNEQFRVCPDIVSALLAPSSARSEWFYLKNTEDVYFFYLWWKYEFTKMARRSFGDFVFESLQGSLDWLLGPEDN